MSDAAVRLLLDPGYEPPFKFTGTLYGATVDVSGDLIKDEEAEMRVLMARQ